MQAAMITDAEERRQQQIDEMAADHGTEWSEPYKPGSFGCHELLDRTSLAVDIVEPYIISHPACIRERDWFALAEQAVTALRELYQRISEKHLDDKRDAAGQS